MKKSDEVINQYSTSQKLEARIQLHQRFSQNPIGWNRWIKDQYSLERGSTILELGSGTGSFWLDSGYEDKSLQVVVSDISQGMLDTCKDKLKDVSFIKEYRLIDAQQIPYDDESFDIVIGNHMLYHLPDLQTGLKEIYRVLKPGGKLYAGTNSVNNMMYLASIIEAYQPTIDLNFNELIRSFCLETGQVQLEKFFTSVLRRDFLDSLVITEVKPIVDYIFSLDGIYDLKDILIKGEEELYIFIENLMGKDHSITIEKNSGIFIATK